MRNYEHHISKLGRDAEQRIQLLWAAVRAGELARDEFYPLAVDLVSTSRLRAGDVARLILRAQLEVDTGRPVTAVPARAPAGDDLDRLTKAVSTITASEQLDTGMQLRRLAYSETVDSAAQATEDGIRRHRQVEGWTRGLDVDACELCQWWWRDGRVWRPDTPMQRHPGCTCSQVATVVSGLTDNAQSDRQAASAAKKRDQRTTQKESAR